MCVCVCVCVCMCARTSYCSLFLVFLTYSFLPIYLVSFSFPLSLTSEIRINLQEGVKLAKDVCRGMAYIHTMETLTQRFELNSHHVVVSGGGRDD